MITSITEILPDSYFFNYSVLVASLLIVYLVLTDDRFSFNRKFLFFVFLGSLGLISYNLEKAPYLIIQDLFWYSLILNGSFIFHTLILDRIFHYCWKNNYEYLGFLISRLSFTLSLSFLNYIIWKLRCFLQYFFNKMYLTFYYDENKDKNNFWVSYAFFYLNFIETNLLLNFTFSFIYYLIHYSCTLIRMICINFSINFNNYSLLLMGKQKKEFNIYFIIKYILQFGVLLIISILIGYPRLYIIWLIQAIIECYNIFNLKYHENGSRRLEFKEFNFMNKIKYIYDNYKKIGYLHFYYEYKYKLLDDIYERPYHPFFMFDLCKFNFFIQAKQTKYSRFWGDFCWSDLDNESFPINSIYNYNKWEDMAKGYIKSANNYWEENVEYGEERDKILRIAEALFWTKLINKNQDYLDVLIPDIRIGDQDLKLAEELLKKYYE